MGRTLKTPGEPTTETEVTTENTQEVVASNVPTNDVPTLVVEKEPTTETEVEQMSQAEMQAMILSLQAQVAQQKPQTVIPVTEPKETEQRSRVVLGAKGWTREYY